jgi:hypothetical protein
LREQIKKVVDETFAEAEPEFRRRPRSSERNRSKPQRSRGNQ